MTCNCPADQGHVCPALGFSEEEWASPVLTEGGGVVFVPGEPQPKGSTKSFTTKTGRVVTTADNPDTKPWQAVIASFVRQEIGSAISIPAGPVTLDLEFVMPRRKAEPKRVTPAHTRKPDLDKLARAVLDALKGLAYTDDNQVVQFTRLVKRTAEIGEQPGVWIVWAEALIPTVNPTPRMVLDA